MRNVKAVIFDIGQVLVSISSSGEKFGRLMQAAGIAPGEGLDKFSFLNEVRRHMLGEITSREFYQLAVDRFNLHYSYDDFVEGWCDQFHPMPGMEELFREIAARYRVGLLSDTDPLHWAALCGLMPWLAAVEKPTLSFTVGRLKPHPDIYSAAAENVGVAKNECLFIDDKIENVDGARYFGMLGLQFNGVEKLRKDLTGLKVL